MKSIFTGLLLAIVTVFSPYVLNDKYQNPAKWSVLQQFIFLWICITIIIYCLNRIKQKRIYNV